MEAAAIPQNHRGAWPAQPRDNPAPAARPDASCGAFVQGGARRSGREQLNSRTSKTLWGLPVDPSGLHKQQLLCLLPPDAVRKQSPGYTISTGPSWPCSNSVTATVPADQFLLLTNLASALTHSCLSQGGKTGFCCSGSRLLPPWKGKGFREATGQGTWGRAELAVCSV